MAVTAGGTDTSGRSSRWVRAVLVRSASAIAGLMLAVGSVSAATPGPSSAPAATSGTSGADASPAASAASGLATLRVYGVPIEPFVLRDGEKASGYSIDIWEAIALRAGYRTELSWVDDIDGLLDAVRSGQADVAVGPISMTPDRERTLDFTYPYSTGGLGIMVPTSGAGPLDSFIEAIVHPAWLVLALVLVILIVGVGLVIWLPRRGREGWPTDTRTALHESAWRSARAFLSSDFVGSEPRSGLGRLAAIAWVVAGIVFTSLFTAAVTSNATVDRLQSSIAGPGDLGGKRIVSVSEGASADWLSARGLPWRQVSSLDEAYGLLLQGAADAIVFDQLVLRYHATAHGGGRLAVVGPPFELDPYGFALQPGSPYREAIDTALLSLIHDGTLDALHTRWFGATQ
jgi:polar amino acid transport system substrate-binding protein